MYFYVCFIFNCLTFYLYVQIIDQSLIARIFYLVKLYYIILCIHNSILLSCTFSVFLSLSLKIFFKKKNWAINRSEWHVGIASGRSPSRRLGFYRDFPRHCRRVRVMDPADYPFSWVMSESISDREVEFGMFLCSRHK